MKKLHPMSFGLGFASGLVVLVVVVAAMHMMSPRGPRGFAGGFGGGTQNVGRMAQRFGMTQDELQKELDSGKTIQQVATEHGVQFGGRGQNPSAAGNVNSGTGSAAQSSSITSTSSHS